MFSWSSSAGKYPGGRNRQSFSAVNGHAQPGGYSRADHIRSFVEDPMLRPSTRRVSVDDSTYDTVFQTKANDALILRVHLPPAPAGGPCPAPAMTLVGFRATHPWIDNRMRVNGYPPIANVSSWASSGLTLGQCVNAVVQHFQLSPPDNIEITDEGLKKIQPKFPSPSQHNTSNADPSIHTQTINQSLNEDKSKAMQKMEKLNIPVMPSTFPELDQMSRDEIDSLLNDETKFIEFITNIPAVGEIRNLRDSIVDEAIQLANSNISKEKELKTLKDEIDTIQKTMNEKFITFNKLEGKKKKLCMPPNKVDVLKQLQNGKKSAFNESEELAAAWVEGSNLDSKEFSKQFLEKKKVYHVRAAKIERLTQ